MMTPILRAEFRLLLADRRLRWLASVLFVLMAANFGIAVNEASRTSAEAIHTTAVERQRWLDQDPKNPHSAAHYGIWVFKPSSPLATLDPGIEPYVGRMIRIEAHRYNDALYRSAQDKSPLARIGSSTVADILHLIVPLAAILLGFSVFAADRERGTLRLALGNGVAPGQLLLARFAALLGVTALIVGTPAVLLGGIAISVLHEADWQAWLRLLLWTTVQIGYAAFFLLLALLASLLARTSRDALAAALLGWVLLCVVAPRFAATGVEATAPTPSYATTRARIEDQIKHYNRADLHQQRQDAILAKYGVASANELPIDLRGVMMHDREQHDYAVFDRELGNFFARLARQERLHGMAGLLSPMIAVQAVSAGLAGSDFRRHGDFLRAAEAYRRVLSDTMNLDLIDHPAHGGVYLAAREVWEKVPAFIYQPAPLSISLQEIAVPAALLLLWVMLAAALTAAAARRIKP